MDQVAVALDEATSASTTIVVCPLSETGVFAAVQIYPTPVCLADGLRPGGTLKLKMGPYRTRRDPPDACEGGVVARPIR